MKPPEWETMKPEERKKMAFDLFQSVRGNYIIGQALALGIVQLKGAKFPEESNIQDMEMLGEQFFELGYVTTNQQIQSSEDSLI